MRDATRNATLTLALLMLLPLAACGQSNGEAEASATPSSAVQELVAGPSTPADNLHGKTQADSIGGKPGDVGSASASPESEEDAEAGFNPNAPKLGGLALGMSARQVEKRLGSALDQYDLPDEDAADGSMIRMREYDGLTVGTNSLGRVVYAEVFGAEVATGIQGLRVAEPGEDAARALGLPFSEATESLSLHVKDGLLKVDLDPLTKDVLSVKLIRQP